MQKLLSIIIPTYNMENYLEACLDSLLTDNMSLIEVLVINDGSQDSSYDIAKRYGDKYPETFVIIDKGNGNYGSCVNVGLRRATGKYIKVLDADDCFNTRVFEAYLNAIKECDTDMVISDYVKVYPELETIVSCDIPEKKILDFRDLCKDNNIWNLWMHNVAYKRELLLGIDYKQTEGISYTDQEWIFSPFTAVKTAIYFKLPLYRYTLGREGQTMSSAFSDKHFRDNIVCTCNMIEQACHFNNVPDEVMNMLNYKLLKRCRFIFRTYMLKKQIINDNDLDMLDNKIKSLNFNLYKATGNLPMSMPLFPIKYISVWRKNHNSRWLRLNISMYKFLH
jgi:glycosyltransferase involved in cell wall biosynthesis